MDFGPAEDIATTPEQARQLAAEGTYNFQWRMLREGVAWFGDYTVNQPLNVVW